MLLSWGNEAGSPERRGMQWAQAAMPPSSATGESAPGEASLCAPVSHSRNLCQMQEDNSSFSLLLDLLSELYQKQPKIGYHLLYYLRARWVWSRVRCQEASWRVSLLSCLTPQPPWLSSPELCVCLCVCNSFKVYNSVVLVYS